MRLLSIAIPLLSAMPALAAERPAGVKAGLPVTVVWTATYNNGGGATSEAPNGITVGPDGHPAIVSRANTITHVEKYNSANGASIWARDLATGQLGQPLDIAANSLSDIIVGGSSGSTASLSAQVNQLASANGATQWAQTYAAGSFPSDGVRGVAVGPSNAVATASSRGGSTSGGNFDTRSFTAGGAQNFAQAISGPLNTFAVEVVFDSAGGVIATGERNNGTNADCQVVKYNSAGTQQWSVALTGSAAGSDRCFDVAVDASDNVFVAGRFSQDNAGTVSIDAGIIKLNGATGGEVWRRMINGAGNGTDQAVALAMIGSDPVYAGYVTGAPSTRDILSGRLNGTTGAVTWQNIVDGPTGSLGDEGRDVAVDSAGSVYVVASVAINSAGPNFNDHYTVKYDGSTGALVWDQQYDRVGRQDAPPNVGSPGIAVAAPDVVYVVVDSVNAAGDQDVVTLKYTAAGAPEINVQGNGNTIVDGDATPSATDHTDFGGQSVASGTIVRTFTIQNTGTGSLTVGTPTIGGTHAADFTVSANPAANVPAAGSTTFQVTFNPSASGLRSATVSFSNNDGDENPYNFAVQGTGLAPEIDVKNSFGNTIADGDSTPSAVKDTDFGSRSVASGTTGRLYTILNAGSATLTLSAPTISGAHAADFTVAGLPAGSLAPAQSTTFAVIFDPSAPGLRSASVIISNNDADENPYNFAIQGIGTEPEVNVQGNGNTIVDGDATPSLTDHTDFGTQSVASGTVVRTYTIQNTGTASLALLGNPTIGGANPGDFTVTANPTTPIAPAGSTTFQVTFDPSAAGLRTATVSFVSDDPDEGTYDFAIQGTGAIGLSINDVTLSEGNSGITNFGFTVSLDSPAGPGGVSFNIATSDGTATAGSDYVANSLTGQTIPAGSSTYSFTVQVNGDTLNEPDEGFTVNVTSISGAVATDAQGAGTINNDDPLPSLSITDVTQAEGNSGGTAFDFSVSLNAASGQTVTVNYVSSNGSASSADYTAVVGTLTFTPGQLTRTVTVPVTGDTILEPNETFFVNLSGQTNAALSDNQGVGTIDNDDAASVSIANLTLVEGNSGTTSFTFTATLSADVQGGFTVPVTSADGSATTADNDYAAIPGGTVLNFTGTAGETQLVTVLVNGDAKVEANETFTVSLGTPSNPAVTLGTGTATGTITNDDSATVSISSTSVTEGNAGNTLAWFTATLSAAVQGGLTVPVSTANGTATAGSDYTALPGGMQLTFAGTAGETANFSVTVTGDTIVEANETFTVNLGTPSNPGVTLGTASGTGTINNDDSATVALAGVSQNEGDAGPTSFVFTATLTGSVQDGFSVPVSSANGTASAGSDYTAIAGGAQLNFSGSNGETQSVTVLVNGDTTVEADETFSVTLGTPSLAGVSANTATATGTINNDDTTTVSIDSLTQVEGNSGTTSYMFTATLAGAVQGGFTVPVSSANGTATAGSDYTAIAGGTQLSFAGTAGETQSVTVVVNGDATVEPNETFTVSLGTPSNAGVTVGTGTGIGTITNDDSTTVSINSVTQAEGYSGTTSFVFTATVVGAVQDGFTVPVSSSNGTATAGSDYTALAGGAQLTFAGTAGETQTVTVLVTGETIVEANETFTVSLGTPSSASVTVGASTGTGTINNDDSATVALAGVTQNEGNAGNTAFVFTATLSAGVQGGFTVPVSSTSGTATAGTDYTAIAGGATLNFAGTAGETQSVTVQVTGETLFETSETFTVTLGTPSVANVSASPASATGTISNDDTAPTLAITSPSQPEGNAGPSTMNFVVSQSAVSGLTTSFNAATADGSATVADNDYQALASTPFTIPAGQTSVTIPVTINGNSVFEGNETFSVNLTGITNATPGTLTGTGTIEDDDQQPTTTTITSDLPDPSVVGQPYLVSVNVAAVTTSPAGTVTISDGTASCGPVTLTAAAAPNATASCNLTSTTAGAKTLTASYTAATTAFGNSSGTTAHQVNPAGTSISVTGPTRSRINQPTAFTFALSVNAPGAGTPTGTVTLTSGASSCTANLPATSCNLSFTTLGSRTVSASYAGDANFNGSSSSGPGNAQTLVYAQSDIAVSKSDAISVFRPGELIVYTVQVRNLGPDAAQGIRVRDDIPAGIANTVWSCDASGGVACPVTGGSGNLDTTTAAFPVGGLLTFTFYGTAQNVQQILNQALVELPADTTVEDLVPGNNTASDLDRNEFIFADGLEDPLVVTAAGSFRVPGLALRAVVGEVATAVYRLNDVRGEALRLYARQFDGQMQYALAQLGADGTWQLGQWQALEGEPLLSWTVIASDTGYRLQGATLR